MIGSENLYARSRKPRSRMLSQRLNWDRARADRRVHERGADRVEPPSRASRPDKRLVKPKAWECKVAAMARRDLLELKDRVAAMSPAERLARAPTLRNTVRRLTKSELRFPTVWRDNFQPLVNAPAVARGDATVRPASRPHACPSCRERFKERPHLAQYRAHTRSSASARPTYPANPLVGAHVVSPEDGAVAAPAKTRGRPSPAGYVTAARVLRAKTVAFPGGGDHARGGRPVRSLRARRD